MYLFSRIAIGLLSVASLLQAQPDISNLNTCINEVRSADINPPVVQTFDLYASNYSLLLADLRAATPNLPYIYQQVAAQPLINFLYNLGESRFLQIFRGQARDQQAAVLRDILPDAALAILTYDGAVFQAVNAFQEIVSDLYDGFIGEERKAGGIPIQPPAYVIPPLVKFGNKDSGPYTWPPDATSNILGMGCGIVSLPPAQISGGLLAWTSLGHETSGHDIMHADPGLLNELANKVYFAVLNAFGSQNLANYWARCIDETTADICGYLNFGPSAAVGLVGYFRALGNGKLRTIGAMSDSHPIDLLRGYLGAAVVKYLNFSTAALWSQTIANETQKDNGPLYLVDQNRRYYAFPVPFNIAVASTDVVAKTILKEKLYSLEGHSLQEIVNWKDDDQSVVDQLVAIFKNGGSLPATLQGPGFYAAYVVAAATQAGLEFGTDLGRTFNTMQSFLASMHMQNPTWSIVPTDKSVAMLDKAWKGTDQHSGKHIVRHEVPEEMLVLAE